MLNLIIMSSTWCFSLHLVMAVDAHSKFLANFKRQGMTNYTSIWTYTWHIKTHGAVYDSIIGHVCDDNFVCVITNKAFLKIRLWS